MLLISLYRGKVQKSVYVWMEAGRRSSWRIIFTDTDFCISLKPDLLVI